MRRSPSRPLPGLRTGGLGRRVTAVLAVTATALTATVALTATAASAGPLTTTLFEESFAGATTTVPSWVMPAGSTGNAACLTAGTDGSQQPIPGCAGSWMNGPDQPGEGVLRLTTPDYSQVGATFYDAGLPSAKGIDVTFDSYQWYYGGVIPADGISFVLAATDPTNPTAPTSAGQPGAGLGYAPVSSLPGVPHGYLGLGLDVAGNFAINDFGGPGNSCGPHDGQSQSVVVRGPGNGIDGYCTLSANYSNGPLDRPWQFDRPAAVPVEVVLNPEDHEVVSSSGLTVPARSWLAAWTPYDTGQQTATGALPTAEDLARAGIPTDWYDPQTALPYQLSFGWAGSTGAGYSFHAIGNVRATTLTGQLPVYQLAVTDGVEGSFTSGTPATVSVTPSLASTGGDESRPATVTTTLPDGLVPTNPVTDAYDCTTTGQVVSCTTTGTTSYAAGSVLPTVTIPVTAGAAALGAQTVTAKVSSTDGNPANARHDVSVRTDQAITFAPLTGPALVSGRRQLVVTGGGSTAPVTLAIGSATTDNACTLVGEVLSFDHTGTCVVTADQAGDAEHNAAPQVTQSVTVELNATSTSLAVGSSTSVYGQPVSATATVAGSAAGVVRFSVDGRPVGDPIALSDTGTATLGSLTGGGAALTPGAHAVSAVFTPTSTTLYAGSTSTPQTVTVSPAATTTTVSVAPDTLTAHVAVTAPGAGSPTGAVRFTVDGTPVGTAAVVDGVATLAYSTPADRSREVAATYLGSTAFLASSGSTARSNPVITARLSSASTRSSYGWYRSPVTVSFTCIAGSAPLVGACPAPVTLSGNGASQGVTRTVAATDGGVATVALAGVNIDAVVPVVRITGVTRGARYFASSPAVKCVGADQLSGLASCSVRRQRSGEVETITATAVDKAGNTATTRLQVRVVSMMVAGAPYANGTYTLRKGHTYTILVVSTTRPRYVDAATYPRTPRGLDHYFTKIGTNRWAIGVTMDRCMRTGYWNLGVRIGSRTLSLKAYVKP